MKRWVLFTMFLVVLSTYTEAQIDYGPRGVSSTLPMAAPAAPPVITSSSNTIPITPSVNPLVITPVVTTIPTVQAVPPPIEPSPSERMASGLRYAYSGNEGGAEIPRGRGVNNVLPGAEDGTGGRSLGEVARAARRCTPKVTGRTFTNDDFGRTSSADGGLPTIVETVCAASR